MKQRKETEAEVAILIDGLFAEFGNVLPFLMTATPLLHIARRQVRKDNTLKAEKRELIAGRLSEIIESVKGLVEIIESDDRLLDETVLIADDFEDESLLKSKSEAQGTRKPPQIKL
jgi:hypothetical protein